MVYILSGKNALLGPVVQGCNFIDAGVSFTPEECKQIIELVPSFNDIDLVDGPHKGEPNSTYNNATKGWINHVTEVEWIYKRLADAAIKANTKTWNFELLAMFQPLTVIRYLAPEGGMGWHNDLLYKPIEEEHHMNHHRKLNVLCQLSDPNEYEGGDLYVTGTGIDDLDKGVTAGNYGMPLPTTKLPREQGSVFVFPSWVWHCVTGVTKGTRYSLVNYMHGTTFK
jgi:PKHD-type hydroxylase